MSSPSDIRARDGHRCSRCGEGGSLHVHHRIRRSQGGRDVAPNMISLCPGCHKWVHANPYAARRQGLLLGRSADPAQVPVDHALFPDGPVLLGNGLDFILWQTELRRR
jgi:5-methylcytosine-specific restriction endonuclease McrA